MIKKLQKCVSKLGIDKNGNTTTELMSHHFVKNKCIKCGIELSPDWMKKNITDKIIFEKALEKLRKNIKERFEKKDWGKAWNMILRNYMDDDNSAYFKRNHPEVKKEMKKDSSKNYWLTPPKHYKTLNDEFHFDFDPCPFPKPDDFDGLTAEWGKVNYVNPPFKKEDGGGIAYWVTKGIEENKKGKTVVFLIHVDRAIMKLIKSGAEIRTLGETAWISTKDGSEGYSHPSAVFILKGK